MKSFRRFTLFGSLLVAAVGAVTWIAFAFAETKPSEAKIEDVTMAEEIDVLNDEITAKRSSAESLKKDIAVYRERIRQKQQEALTFQNEIELLANRITQTQLELQATEKEREAVSTEIRVLDLRVNALDRQLQARRESLAAILTKLDVYDNDLSLQLLFGTDSFAELFDRLEALNNMSSDLQEALDQAQSEKETVTLARAEQESKKSYLQRIESSLEENQQRLNNEQQAKTVFLTQSQESEAEFRQLLADLREEEASINQRIFDLQEEMEAKLNESDAVGDASVLSWPIEPLKGISAGFHDPTYPFRRLFEHPGIDLPTPRGTAVRVAAPGYVAWTKTGVQYGNYIMVIHANGLVTLYAHLSQMSVKADDFVARGEVIGASGGVPGTPGAGLSTGAHLHFEVRKNGVPVNPLGYLIERDL